MTTFIAESNQFDPSFPLRQNVTLPVWVNDPLPSFAELLSAHDVARLTRRPKLVISGLMLLRRFPQKHRYRGRQVGWLRSDVLDWMARGLTTDAAELPPRPRARGDSRRACLPLKCCSPCIATRRQPSL